MRIVTTIHHRRLKVVHLYSSRVILILCFCILICFCINLFWITTSNDLSMPEEDEFDFPFPVMPQSTAFWKYIRKTKATNRQKAVIAEAKHSWQAYKRYAWGHDFLKPKSRTFADGYGVGLTIIDSLDTLYLMNLVEEFNEGVAWVHDYLSFDGIVDGSLFELTIRVLGGLLSSYYLSGYTILLRRSVELGNKLLPLFNSPTGLPYQYKNNEVACYLSEVGSLQLEFRELSYATKNQSYENAIQLVNEKLHNLEKFHGLTPVHIFIENATINKDNTITMGAFGDSYYEYLLKQWIQTGCAPNSRYIIDYKNAIDGVMSQLVRRTACGNYTYIVELNLNGRIEPHMDHLTCFLPGTLILGHHFGMPDSHLALAKDLMETCLETYFRQATGLAPDRTSFNDTSKNNCSRDFITSENFKWNRLRPEVIESLYYFYVFTGRAEYQDIGWFIFKAFKQYSRLPSGYCTIANTMNIFKTPVDDVMESFWMSETLKYFYLLFSNNQTFIDVTKDWVLNTEAHLLPIRALKPGFI